LRPCCYRAMPPGPGLPIGYHSIRSDPHRLTIGCVTRR
jgi:hypothetical protein